MAYRNSQLCTISKMATVGGINGKNTGQITLFTVPAGKSFVMTQLFIRDTAQTLFVTSPTYHIGTAGGGYDEWSQGGLVITGLIGVSGYGNSTYGQPAGGGNDVQYIFPAGSVIKIDITVGAVATTLTLEASVFGYLF